MKGKMRSLKVVIAALLAIVLGTACFVGAGAVLLLFSGPFSDAQSSPTIYSPIDNITISDRGRYRLRWEVDDRFSVEFGNGFVIRNGTSLSSFPDGFVLKRSSVPYPSGKPLTSYFVQQDGNDYNAAIVYVDEREMVRQVGVACDAGNSHVSIVDLRSGKKMQVYNAAVKDMVAFFKGLAR